MLEKLVEQKFEVIVKSDEQFPVDFDDAWVWIGYSTKQKAKEMLLNNFKEGVDFSTLGLKSPINGRPSIEIALTIDCFKTFCMLAQTEKGKEVFLNYNFGGCLC